MESLDEITKTNSKKSFFKHVFNFNDDSKEEMLNIIQYALLALIPIVVLNKLMNKYIPQADENKGNIELSAEIIIQIIIIFLGLLFIHRIITYIPTYSGAKYSDFSITNIILAVLLIILSYQSKLGEKVNILVDRFYDLWDGNKNDNKNKNVNIKVVQPISQNNISNSNLNPIVNNNTSLISSLPSNTNNLIQTPPQQQYPDYDKMYTQDNNPLVGAQNPSSVSYEGMSNNIMAANEGGAFASPFSSGW